MWSSKFKSNFVLLLVYLFISICHAVSPPLKQPLKEGLERHIYSPYSVICPSRSLVRVANVGIGLLFLLEVIEKEVAGS